MILILSTRYLALSTLLDWQLVLVGLLVAAAAWYLVRASWRTWTAKKGGCGGGCGCGRQATAPRRGDRTVIPVQEVTLRRREHAAQ
jgi:hypothetical protein